MEQSHLYLLVLVSFNVLVSNRTEAQVYSNPSEANQSHLVSPSNLDYAGLEKDILLYAGDRYQVSQTGSAQVNLATLFDGKYVPFYTSSAPSDISPTVILIENLPDVHIQRQAWTGWTTRYEAPKKFKIEAYNTWTSRPVGWITLAEVDNNSSNLYITALPSGSYTKLRFTIYEGNTGVGGKFGFSEIFFLHNEIAQAYDGLMVKYQPNGNVLIGKTSQTNSSYKLDVNGNIRANKVVVNTSGADYVFNSAYHLIPLDSLKAYIGAHHHLPGIPSAKQMQQEGMSVGDAYTSLLQKMEEMTKYILTLNQQLRIKDEKIKQVEERIKRIENHKQ